MLTTLATALAALSTGWSTSDADSVTLDTRADTGACHCSGGARGARGRNPAAAGDG